MSTFLKPGLSESVYFNYCLTLVWNRIVQLHGAGARSGFPVWEELPSARAHAVRLHSGPAKAYLPPGEPEPREKLRSGAPGIERDLEWPWTRILPLPGETGEVPPSLRMKTIFTHKQLFLLENVPFYWANSAWVPPPMSPIPHDTTSTVPSDHECLLKNNLFITNF